MKKKEIINKIINRLSTLEEQIREQEGEIKELQYPAKFNEGDRVKINKQAFCVFGDVFPNDEICPPVERPFVIPVCSLCLKKETCKDEIGIIKDKVLIIAYYPYTWEYTVLVEKTAEEITVEQIYLGEINEQTNKKKTKSSNKK